MDMAWVWNLVLRSIVLSEKREWILYMYIVQFEKYSTIMSGLKDKNNTGGHSNKLNNSCYRSYRLVFLLTQVHQCPFGDKGPTQNSYLLARGKQM